MSKTVEVTNPTSNTNTGQVKWKASMSGSWNTDILNPGDVKSYTIANGTEVVISGPASLDVKDTGTTNVAAHANVYSTLAPAEMATFTFDNTKDNVGLS